ncbi:MAG: hypothetical protein AAGF11_29845 [Myxococcota bacterium]
MAPSRTIALVVALTLGLPLRSTAARQGPVPAESEVARLLDEADRAFEQGRLLDAWDAIDEAEALAPEPFYEYMRGLIRQAQGRCDRAVEHWARYLDSNPAQSDAADVRVLIDECGGLPEPTPAPAPTPTPAPPRPTPEPTPAPTPPKSPATTPWHRDVTAGVLLGVGIASLVTSGGLLLGAGQQQRRAPRGESLMVHDTRIRRARGLSYGAIAAGTVGIALVVGAIVRYARIRRQTERRPTVPHVHQ